MIKLIYENDTYYFNNGKVYDDSFLEVPQVISKKVVSQYYDSLDYKNFNEQEFLEYLKNIKVSELYDKCIDAIEYSTIKFINSSSFCRTIFPIATSCYRLRGEAEKAIYFWEQRKVIFNFCKSEALFTSLAAAYCDIKDYVNAKKYADRACALCGGPQKMDQELIGVYSRIKAETSNK